VCEVVKAIFGILWSLEDLEEILSPLILVSAYVKSRQYYLPCFTELYL
jgi:hypothetical protein